MLNQLREHGLAEVHASLSYLNENGSEMVVSRKIQFKSFLTEIAVTPTGTIDYSRRPIFTRTAVTYCYESENGFSADIVVDDLGLVVKYPSGWERVGVS